MSSSDRILVRDLRLWAHVGVLPHERELGQWFELDIELEPLTQLTLMGKNTHMGPEAEVPHQDAIRGTHKGQSR